MIFLPLLISKFQGVFFVFFYRPKRCGNSNKNEDNSPKNLDDKNQQASSQKFRQLNFAYLKKKKKYTFWFSYQRLESFLFLHLIFRVLPKSIFKMFSNTFFSVTRLLSKILFRKVDCLSYENFEHLSLSFLQQ